jgi:nicotinamidase-related amidase
MLIVEAYMPTSGSVVTQQFDRADIARMPLEADKCALLVIDIQEKLLPPIFNKDVLVRNTQLLLRLAKILGTPVMASTQYEKGLGRTVPEINELLPDSDTTVDKVEFSCFGSDRFCSGMKTLPRERNTVLLCGMETHICVMQTALAALDKGYIVHVAADAVGSRSEFNWKIGLERMRDAGCVISTTEMMMYELLRQSGTPAFKELLKYIK